MPDPGPVCVCVCAWAGALLSRAVNGEGSGETEPAAAALIMCVCREVCVVKQCIKISDRGTPTLRPGLLSASMESPGREREERGRARDGVGGKGGDDRHLEGLGQNSDIPPQTHEKGRREGGGEEKRGERRRNG